MYTVYGMAGSGNCYKVRLLLEQLGEKYEWRETDIMKGATRTPEYRANVNANGRVPAVVLPDGRILVESNAILDYTHVAETGDMDLNRFPTIQAWLRQVREQPGFIAMPHR